MASATGDARTGRDTADTDVLDSLMLDWNGAFALCLTMGCANLAGGFRLVDMMLGSGEDLKMEDGSPSGQF